MTLASYPGIALTSQRRAELLREAAEIAGRLIDIPWAPQQPTEKQAKFLLDFSRESLYGGAGGGGKVQRCSWQHSSSPRSLATLR